MEAECSSETSADFQQTTWRYIREELCLYVVSIYKLIKLSITIQTVWHDKDKW
jgi:hypothetical protein